MSDTGIAVEILDTMTGKRAWADDETLFSPYWWHEGNGSCDCNRGLLAFPDECETKDYCLGCHRYLIVATRGDTEGLTLWDFNKDYPEDLVAEHIGRPAP